MNTKPENYRIAVIGLGYVGLPLAIEFGRQYNVIGYDISEALIAKLEHEEHPKGLTYTSDSTMLRRANVYIIAVPTPIDRSNTPDLRPLLAASKSVGLVLKPNDIVIYESTVYPGCTEEECVPVLEKFSGLSFNKDFYCGYSPERINPGDKEHTLVNIRKITSGSTPEVAQIVDTLYNSILKNGTYPAPSIRVAEAAKVVENCQRDLNISFMNELALICDQIGLDTNDVIDAASTKWNFLPFRPGLVGGHCISVDPYYLAHKARTLGYDPKVILSGRAVNNSIAKFIADKVLKLLIQKGHAIVNANVLILGVTFKENCPDCRNSKVVDIFNELRQFGCHVDVYDPWASPAFVRREFGITLVPEIDRQREYNAVIACVAHDEFRDFDWEKYRNRNAVIFDVKGFVPRDIIDARL